MPKICEIKAHQKQTKVLPADFCQLHVCPSSSVFLLPCSFQEQGPKKEELATIWVSQRSRLIHVSYFVMFFHLFLFCLFPPKTSTNKTTPQCTQKLSLLIFFYKTSSSQVNSKTVSALCCLISFILCSEPTVSWYILHLTTVLSCSGPDKSRSITG